MEQKQFIKYLILATSLLISIYSINVITGNSVWFIIRLFDLDQEANIPTWFSSLMLAVAAYFAYQCDVASKLQGFSSRIWLVLSWFFLALSCDEVAQIHENAGKLAHKYFLQSFGLNSPWVIIIGPFALVVVFFLAMALRKALKGSTKARTTLVAGASVYICGAFGIELLGTVYEAYLGGLAKLLDVVIEESFEMFGVIMTINGLMAHMNYLSKHEKLS